MTRRRPVIPLVATSLLAAMVATPLAAQGGPTPRDTTAGYPITDQTVVQACQGCHVRDSTGRMSRISYARKTPEGWEMSIRRMVALNGARLDPNTARAVLRYLADHQGLAPAEMQPGRFEAERRMIDYRYTADTRTETTCRACHSMGRVITQRRDRPEWELLLATHRGLYPDADFQAFRRGGPPPDTGDASHPMDRAAAHLARAFPLRTPEWTAWSATMRAPRLAGTWLLSGAEPGKGSFYGTFTVTPVAGSEQEFTTHATYRYARGGPPVTRNGKSIVYTGFQWRGRSGEATKPDDQAWREVMFVEPGWQEMSGRWFMGAHDEFGMDVSLRRATGSPVIAGISQRGLRTGGAGQEVTLFGANLPQGATPAAVDFGPGITVEGVVRSSADELTVRVAVAPNAALGSRDLVVGNASLRDAVVVYDKVSRIKVTPAAGMARVGGAVFPKQMQQFDAVALHDGYDGKPNTPDDLNLGAVPVTWSLEEYGTTYDDDDIKFVGTIDTAGLFTPNLDGPNTARSGSRNNIGDVWVVATHTPPGEGAKPIKGRAHLLVTVPLYMRWQVDGVPPE